MKAAITAVLIISFLLITGVSSHFKDYTANRGFRVQVVADDQELLRLVPNQPYAYIGQDGKLYIDISPSHPKYPGYGAGLSPDTLYAFDCMFYVKNTLWENQTVTFVVNSSSPSVMMYAPTSATAYSPETATQHLIFQLGWMEETCVGFVFDMRNGQMVGVSLNATI
ncbi:DUF1102 domain-containing protein [Geoglobus acetivorans]|uniref:DUF1102 domain-containing protein n=1 Tax=Geoglobus acetivorans TaxID=565033 RepID=A0ABZ3H537_GEOAI|nr:DUF1102 domain-containing protein [Geoglobus acetivorans]